eukprot:m.919941 g.919941  ORF g.919941 m.919941 type:complete len:57 (-) comp60556_c0_seq1:88-258(-)
MSFAQLLYRTVMRRNSTFLATGLAGAFVFERVFDPTMDSYYNSRNKGKLFSDIKFQ